MEQLKALLQLKTTLNAAIRNPGLGGPELTDLLELLLPILNPLIRDCQAVRKRMKGLPSHLQFEHEGILEKIGDGSVNAQRVLAETSKCYRDNPDIRLQDIMNTLVFLWNRENGETA